MKASEFRRAVEEEFGVSYSSVLIRDHWLVALGGTAQEALEAGVPAKTVWLALCDDFAIPEDRRHGRGLIDPQK
ncbi:DUF3046 domain-containing protein [Canibacter zhoujuaniae]|uniref:DUF3046 domain-containing protein n=1 Tax=Canibacter zhoujuaniae TaxID=2708343 RepID=UPI0014249ECA|nr:DUF3046 domain-containing protein [Canibacter zhoujuaniae]